MAVSAYASLVSLTHVLDNLHYRAQFHLPRVDTAQIEMLQEKVSCLLKFVELHSGDESSQEKGLWQQISEIALEAEDMIDFHVVNQLHKRYQEEVSGADFSDFSEDIVRVISKADLIIKQEFPSIEEKEKTVVKQSTSFVPADGSLVNSFRDKNVLVGIDNHVDQIIEKLTRRHETNLQFLPIVGMGGIGKTTLARTVFHRQYIIDHFRIRLWVTISQNYSPEQILLGLLNEGGNRGTSESLAELGGRLYEKLFDQRYLIVMDDVWTHKAWDDIKRFIPNDRNGSRILLTSRLSSVATLLGSHNPHLLSFLDEETSLDLLNQTVFGQTGCLNDELATIGSEIAKNCRGLPLEIVVIGRLLAKSDMTRESWEFVARNMSSLSNLGDDEHCLKTLYLSYENLPIHLKPCFLYMRSFPEDSAIKISNLVGFWIAEGYIQLARNKSLEEIGNEYVRELIDRNLIFLNMYTDAYCGVHDLLRDLCVRESNKEHLVRYPKVQCIDMGTRFSHCHLCQELLEDKEGMDLHKQVPIFPCSTHLSPFVCNACETLYSQPGRPRLVRTVDGREKDSWKEIVQPLGLRYSSMIYFDELNFVSPSRVHLFWNLQRLIITSAFIELPHEIWEMPQLRVIDVSDGVLPNPLVAHIEGQDFIVLNSLYTLRRLTDFSCPKEILDRVPNLKNLDIIYRNVYQEDGKSLNYSLCNLEQLQKLEELKVWNAKENISFPNSLKSLSLWHYRMPWEEMSIFGLLPNLEELSLYSGTKGSEWNSSDGEFRKLKRLHLTSPFLVRWEADSFHFPALEELELELCNSLRKIPSGMGYIDSLQSIKLIFCSKAVVESGMKIWKKQRSNGNESLKLFINRKEYETSDSDTDSDDSG